MRNRRRHGVAWATVLALPLAATPAAAKGPSSDAAIQKMAKKLGVVEQPLIVPPGALDRSLGKLAAAKAGKGTVRVLHLGDSHVAADLITGRIRDRLQARFGDAGRGFMQPSLKKAYGGRQLGTKGRWDKTRHVDDHKEHRDYGFSGVRLTARAAKASVSYALDKAERRAAIYYLAEPEGAKVSVLVDGKAVGELDASAAASEGRVARFEWTRPAAKLELRLSSSGPFALVGVSLETGGPGLLYEPIGPVGADAKLYTEFGPASYAAHLSAHAPDLVVLMVGGNDALKIRKGWTTLENVRADHEQAIALIRKSVPDVECVIWGPMDAGDKVKGKVVSKEGIAEIRDLQKTLSARLGCAFWDTYAFMGGDGAIARWDAARVMNKDLVHPKQLAADVIGEGFAAALLAGFDR